MLIQKLLFQRLKKKIEDDWQKQNIPNDLSNDFQKYHHLIKKCYSNATHWHGTGRYHYATIGKSKYESVDPKHLVDTLKQIILEKGLKPHEDPWVKVNGAHSSSVSTTQWRMYGRTYVELHMFGVNKINPVYGKREDVINFFFYYTLLSSPIIALIKSLILAFNKEKLATKGSVWAKTINDQLKSRGNSYSDLLYILGKCASNIKQNYGILFGINGVGLKEAHINPIIHLFESRFTHKIPISKITHLEVPRNFLVQTEKILNNAKINIPVLPIELCEIYNSKTPIQFFYNDKSLPKFTRQEFAEHIRLSKD